MDESKISDALNTLQKYIDIRFDGIEKLYRQKEKNDTETSKKIIKIEDDISRLKTDTQLLFQRMENNDEEIKTLEKYKEVVNCIDKKTSAMATKLESIQITIDKKQKNTLTIAIAMISPFIGATAALILQAVIAAQNYGVSIPPTP